MEETLIRRISIALSSAESQLNATTTLLKSLHSARADEREFLSFGRNKKPFFRMNTESLVISTL